MRDPYTVLGVTRSANAEEIKSAYRRLAKRYHPDSNSADPQAATLFQDVQGAYSLLKDAQQRRRYDRGEIDAAGAPRMTSPFPRRHKPPPPPPRSESEDGEDALFSELFASLRRAKKSDSDPTAQTRAQSHSRPSASAGAALALSLSLEEASEGTRTTVELPTGRHVLLTVPAGVEDGQLLRLKAQDDGADIHVRIRVEPHPRFTRHGLDIACELGISLPEAVLGGKVRVPTLQGEVVVAVPANSNTGTVLKLRGRGVRRADGEPGDQLVTLRIVLPESPDAELQDFLRDWSHRRPYQVRR